MRTSRSRTGDSLQFRSDGDRCRVDQYSIRRLRVKLVANRELTRHPYDIAHLPSGKVVVLSSSEEGTFCEAFDSDLASVWCIRLDEKAQAFTSANDGTLWVLETAGAFALTERGKRVSRVDVRMPEKMHLSAFERVENGFVFAWQHDIGTPMCAPTLARVQDDGLVCWSAALPLENVAYQGVVQMRAEEGWKPRPIDAWTPETWLSTSRNLSVSGDAVLACFSEMPRSGIGFGYVVSLADGTLQFTTQKGPIHEFAPLDGGAFLVGFQGYGTFETLRYERDGRVQSRWASHGYYVLRNDEVRVIEMENTIPSKMHLVRLLPHGSVAKGAWLDGYYTSRPFQRDDGTLCFFRKGELLAARDLSIDNRIMLCAPDDMTYSTKIVGDEQGVCFAYVQSGKIGACLVRVDF